MPTPHELIAGAVDSGTADAVLGILERGGYRIVGDLRPEVVALIVGGVRPEIIAFAFLMEKELRNNDHKSGWKGDSPLKLAKRVREEADELEEVAFDASTLGAENFREKVGEEAADVANMAMMVADVCGCLK